MMKESAVTLELCLGLVSVFVPECKRLKAVTVWPISRAWFLSVESPIDRLRSDHRFNQQHGEKCAGKTLSPRGGSGVYLTTRTRFISGTEHEVDCSTGPARARNS